MKNIIGFFPVLLFSVLFIMEGCTKSQVQADPPTSSAPSSPVTTGTWNISSFIQRTEDKSSLFDGYVFTFVNGGILKAEKSGVVTSGTWAFATAAISYYGATPSKSSFTINLGGTTPFDRLTKTWNIDSTHSNASTLTLISPEVVENMHVIFSKQ
jgi:hypothetical protein